MQGRRSPWQSRKGGSASGRDQEGRGVRLEVSDGADNQQQQERVLKRETEKRGLLAHHAGGSACYREGLGRNHLSHNPAARVGGGGQERIDAEPFRRGFLQAAEEHVARRVRAREEDADPAEDGGDERK